MEKSHRKKLPSVERDNISKEKVAKVYIPADCFSGAGDVMHRFADVQRKRNQGGLIMGAIIMSVMVIVIAVVGFIYFKHQDEKEAQKVR